MVLAFLNSWKKDHFMTRKVTEIKISRTSLGVQWLRLCTPNAGGMGLIPGWGTKIPHATQHGQK